MNVFSGIFFEPFEGFKTWCIFDSKGGIASYFKLPLKFKELLDHIFTKNGSMAPVQFMIIEEKVQKTRYVVMSLCHPIFDDFNPKLGIEICKGRLSRLMHEGYMSYKGETVLGQLKWVYKANE